MTTSSAHTSNSGWSWRGAIVDSSYQKVTPRLLPIPIIFIATVYALSGPFWSLHNEALRKQQDLAQAEVARQSLSVETTEGTHE